MRITITAKVLVTIVLGGVTAVIAIPADAQTTTTEDTTTTLETTTTITTTTFLIMVDYGCNPPPGKPRGLCPNPPVTTPTTRPPAGHGSKPRLKSLYPSG